MTNKNTNQHITKNAVLNAIKKAKNNIRFWQNLKGAIPTLQKLQNRLQHSQHTKAKSSQKMSFLEIVICEYKAIFSNKLVVMVVLIGSLVYGLLYPMPYLNDIVTKQRLVIIDEDKSDLSRRLIFLASSTPQIALLDEVDSLQSAQNLVERFEADGVLLIPQGFESNAKKGVGSVVSYMGNASYFLIYGAIIEGVHNAINALSEEVRKQREPSLRSSEIITLESIPLYNTNLGYSNYALAAVLVFILHQTSIAGSGIISAYQNRIRKEKWEKVKAKKPKQDYSPVSTANIASRAISSKESILLESRIKSSEYFEIVPVWELICARILAFFGIYAVLFLLYFGVLFPTLGINIHASVGDFWCFSVAFIACCVACGVALGSFFSDESIPTQVIFVSSMPLVFILGFIWPSELLPAFLRELSYLIPAFHGVRGLISLNQMGAEFTSIMGHFYAFFAIGGFCFFVAFMVLSYRRREHI